MADNKLPLFEGAGKFYVYLYRDPRPKKNLAPIYVGKGTAAHGRADVHWKKGATNIILARVLDKIRGSGLEPIIEIVAWYDDEEIALLCEISLIAKYGRRDLGQGPLCNMTDGGDGVSGLKHSQETRKKLSEISKAVMPDVMADPEIRARISNAVKDRMADPAVRENLSVKQAAKMADAENRTSISDAMTAFMANPIEREKRRQAMLLICADPSFKERKSAISEVVGRREDVRQKRRVATVGNWNDPDVRGKRVAGLKTAMARPEEKARRAALMRERMADPAYRKKIQDGIAAAKLAKLSSIEIPSS